MFGNVLRFILEKILETLKYWWACIRRCFSIKQYDEYGNKEDKSSHQVALIRVLFAFLILAFLIISSRVSYLVITKGDEYKKKVYDQRQTTDEIIPYQRGSIYDSKGTVLASNIKKYIVVLDAKQVTQYAKDKGNPAYIEATADALHDYLGFDKQEILDFINNNPDDAYERISKDENGKVYAIDAEKIQPLRDAISESVSSKTELAIYGIQFEDSYERVYPNGSLACDVIGYVNMGGQGQYGLEQYYNETLNGINGRSFGYINDYTNLEKEIVPATDGNSLVLSLDASIQRIVEEKMVEVNESMTYEDRAGSYNTGVIIMECDTGKILAMAGYPFYDLNAPREVTIDKYYTEPQIQEIIGTIAKQQGWINGISSNIFFDNGDTPYLKVLNEETGKDDVVMLTKEQLDILEDELSKYARDAIWKNFCISDTYEPGSVAKTITTAIGLDSGKLTGNEEFVCYGTRDVRDRTIRCSHQWGCYQDKYGQPTPTDVRGNLAKSCNPAFTLYGAQIGKTTFLEYTKDMFGVKTNIDLTGEVSGENLVFTEKTMGEVELATSSFGQGYNATMIQMIAAFNSLVNGGNYYEPHVVDKIVDSNGCVVKNIEPRVLKQTVSETTSETMREWLVDVVEETRYCTGYRAKTAGYVIGGKTGTAQISGVGGYKQGEYVVSFMSYAPADNPQIVMYVVIDRPNIADQSTGAVNQACILTKDIYTEVLPYLNIPMTEELTEEQKQELDEKGIYTAHIVTEEESFEDGMIDMNEEGEVSEE